MDARGTAKIPSGSYWTGSSLAERAAALERAYREDPRSVQRAVASLAAEPRPRRVKTGAFFIMTTPVTNAAFHAFVLATGAAEPWADPERWERSNTGYAYTMVNAFAWEHGAPGPKRQQHPVVLVDALQASSYCAWWGKIRGGDGRLPTEAQWERAARGDDQRTYPWGNDFANHRAATLESRLQTTVPVGSSHGASPFGATDLAGNVFEWTRTAGPDGSGPGVTWVVKGGSWNSSAVDARVAARHTRPAQLRHIALGFRCVLEPAPAKPHRARRRTRSGR